MVSYSSIYSALKKARPERRANANHTNNLFFLQYYISAIQTCQVLYRYRPGRPCSQTARCPGAV